MLVESRQNIRIRGLVSCARVQATGSISVGGNILSSVITAGRAPDFSKKYYHKFIYWQKACMRWSWLFSCRITQISTRVLKEYRPSGKAAVGGKFYYLIDALKL